jgi:hypothetical protein
MGDEIATKKVHLKNSILNKKAIQNHPRGVGIK